MEKTIPSQASTLYRICQATRKRRRGTCDERRPVCGTTIVFDTSRSPDATVAPLQESEGKAITEAIPEQSAGYAESLLNRRTNATIFDATLRLQACSTRIRARDYSA